MKRSAIFLAKEMRVGILVFVIGLLTGIALIGATGLVTNNQTQTAEIGASFDYHFNSQGVLKETGLLGESTSPYWWVNSGGALLIDGETGSTMTGTAPLANLWRVLYAASNPIDTDNGTHPQNIFRLVTRSSWRNVQQEAMFYILQDNLSASPNRNASNGLLLMNRYADAGQTLYYAGIRVDGTAVIKKKYKGAYYTMAQKALFPGTYSGSRDNKNLIPHNEWIGLRSEVVTNSNGGVTIDFYMKRAGETSWTKLLEATDNGQYGKTPPITAGGYAGIRTDFMDVKFEEYKLNTI
jgi:hypothetical protein